jgi:large subunit ribosomal protein L6
LSRIGKLPIPVPGSVKIELRDHHLSVEGPKGRLERTLPAQIAIRVEEGRIVCERPSDGREDRSMHGLTRTLVANMVTGVSEGFIKHLELVGVGYRVLMQGEELVLNLGFSHPIRFRPPDGISIQVTDPTHFAVSGASREQVGQVAADLRSLRPPEPYKGKGMMYRGEKVRRKAGKAGKGAK